MLGKSLEPPLNMFRDLFKSAHIHGNTVYKAIADWQNQVQGGPAICQLTMNHKELSHWLQLSNFEVKSTSYKCSDWKRESQPEIEKFSHFVQFTKLEIKISLYLLN